jgi:hypothetical protein
MKGETKKALAIIADALLGQPSSAGADAGQELFGATLGATT